MPCSHKKPDAVPAKAAERLSPEQLARIERRVSEMAGTDHGMADLLDEIAGPGQWAYDQSEDLWFFRDDTYQGAGRGYFVVRRGGSWFRAVVPDEAFH